VALLGVLRPEYRAPSQVAFSSAMALAAWAAGRSVTLWRQRSEAITLAAEMRLHQQELEARQGLAAERTRIARELHDIVAHQISIMVVQAGAAERVLATDPTAAQQAMTRVQEAGQRAIADMYLMLGVLRDDGADVEEPTQPTVGRLGDLVEHITEAGLPTRLRVDGAPRPLPRGLDVSVFRIVQEALTNALKHAGRAQAEVLVRWSDDRIHLEVRDTGRRAKVAPAAGSGGHGLVGLRERVALYGGSLRAEPGPDGGFVVAASIPLRSA
jgi:signal transduction histidine kinase